MNININEVERLIQLESWKKLICNFAPKITAHRLQFREGIITAYRMLFNDEYDDDVRDYAVRLLFAIRDLYHAEWESDWKYDVFLGDACDLTRRYDERHAAFSRAYKKAEPKPPSLLLSLARCRSAPGLPPITLEQAETLVRRALQQELSIEAVIQIRGICREKEDQSQFAYWDKVFQDLKTKNLHTDSCWPNFLSNI